MTSPPRPPEVASPASLLGAQGAELWARSLERHTRRVEVLERAVLALMDGELDNELRELAESEAHLLAGSIGSFGLRAGSRLARALEQSFGAPHTLGRVFAARLADQVLALRRELERPLVLDAGAALGAEHRRLLLISDDAERAEQYVAEGVALGYALTIHSVRNAARVIAELPNDARPHAVVVELSEATCDEGIALLGEIERLRGTLPTLVVSAVDGMALRLAIARSQATGPLALSHAPSDVLQRATPLLDVQHTLQGSILVVDTDPWALESTRLTLEHEGHTVHTLPDPMRFWETLESVAPDLVISGIAMTSLSGLDLCRAMRADPRWRELPLIFVAATDDAPFVRDAYLAGADDVVRKPVEMRELATRVGNRMRRSRLLRRHAEADVLTGLANRRKAERDLDRFLRLARRHRHQVSLALFRIDRFEHVTELHGQGAADHAARWFAHLLQQSFRAEDIVSRWSADDFVVGLFDAGSDDAVARVREVMAALRDERFTAPNGDSFALTCSAGVATFPDDAADPVSLYASADAALVSARVTMPDDALGIASAPHMRVNGRVDVVLVEDDPAVAALVIHALESRQYAVRWLRDGHEAAAALLGESPELRARLVLLEVNLPAFDGLSILRALSAQGKLRQTRAIMLSVRSSEAEVVQAFEMGAFDYVAKPFSVSILVERIRRALTT